MRHWRLRLSVFVFCIGPLALSAKSTPSYIIETALSPKIHRALDSPARWGAEPTISSPELQRVFQEYRRRQIERSGVPNDRSADNDSIEDQASQAELERFLSALLKDQPQIARTPKADYQAKMGQMARALQTPSGWQFYVSVDPGVLEAHIPFEPLKTWQQMAPDLQKFWFNTATAHGFTLGTMSGNGHLTRDIETGFNEDYLWARNALVHFWNHPALSDRIFDRNPLNALSLPRMTPEQRDRRLLFLKLMDSDYSHYLETLEEELSKHEMDLSKISAAFEIKPTIETLMSSYSKTVGSCHDEALNLEHLNRWEFRGFVNQTSTLQMLSQMTFLEQGIQNIHDIDGLIAVNESLMSRPDMSNSNSIRQFLDYGHGLSWDFLRTLLPNAGLRNAFEIEKLKARSQIPTTHTGIRTREIRLLTELTDRLARLIEAEPDLTPEELENPTLAAARNQRFGQIIQVVDQLNKSLPSRARVELEDFWEARLRRLLDYRTQINAIQPEEKANPPSNELYSKPAVSAVLLTPELALPYWQALQRSDRWAMRLRSLVEDHQRTPYIPDTFFLSWLIQYAKENPRSISAEGFDSWIMARPGRLDIHESIKSYYEAAAKLQDFFTRIGLKTPRSPERIVNEALQTHHTLGRQIPSDEAYSVLEIKGLSSKLKARIWPFYSRPNWTLLNLESRQFGFEFRDLDAMTRAEILADERTDTNPSKEAYNNPVECKQVYGELERLIEAKRGATEAPSSEDSEEILKLTHAQLSLPFLGREALEKVNAISDDSTEPLLNENLKIHALQALLRSDELSPMERQSLFESYLKPSANQISRWGLHQTLQRAQAFWTLLRPHEFVEHRSRWRRNLRDLALRELDPAFPLFSTRGAWNEFLELPLEVVSVEELVEAMSRQLDDALHHLEAPDSPPDSKELLFARMIDFSDLFEKKKPRRLPDQTWKILARSIVRHGAIAPLMDIKISKVFWDTFTLEIKTLMQSPLSHEKIQERLERAASALETSIRRLKRVLPREFWNLLRERLSQVDFHTVQWDPEIIDGLISFVQIAQQAPQDILRLRNLWQSRPRAAKFQDCIHTLSLWGTMPLEFTAASFPR